MSIVDDIEAMMKIQSSFSHISHNPISIHHGVASRQRGVTLIEILITLLVLAVGLLGLAALQGISMQSAQIAYQRSQAVNIAYEVTDFARANRSVASAGDLTDFADSMAAQLLPSGQATVDGPDANSDIIVTVTWSEERLDELDGGTSLSETVTTRI